MMRRRSRYEWPMAPASARRRCTGGSSILRNRNPAAYTAAGLSYDTKFDLRQALDLPHSTDWFSVPPAAPQGQTPKLGVLHPSLVRAVQAAFKAATE